MNFASVTYVLFLVLVAAVWNSRERMSPWFLCFFSCLFYAYWFPPYLLLLLVCASLSYVLAVQLGDPGRGARRPRLLIGLLLLMTPLLAYKYVGFVLGFFESGPVRGPNVTFRASVPAALPLGISFYTFQAMSYVLDVYRRRLDVCHRARDYLAYLSFFPQLVAGPIVRAAHFLPQLGQKRRLSRKDLRASLHHLSRGFFLKVVIADNLAAHVDLVFDVSAGGPNTSDAWLGLLMFSIQIFCDTGYLLYATWHYM